MINPNNKNEEVASIVHRNIRTMLELNKEAEKRVGIQHKISSTITRRVGSLPFVYFQIIFLITWLSLNSGKIFKITPFDPFPYPLLALITTVEAIFLAIFILVNQNRMANLEAKREELDIQMSLLTEHEVTRLIRLVDSIAVHLKVQGKDHDIGDLKKETSPEKVLEAIENEMIRQEKQTSKS